MKNRLEDEYRQLMQNETPDLWERISAGIDAKIAADGERKKTAENVEIGQQVKSKNRVITFVKKYSLPLVACIAAILCVPLMLTGFLRMAGGAKSETAAADMVVTESGSMIAEAPAEQYFEECTNDDDLLDQAYYYLAYISMLKGNKDKAIQYLNIAVEENEELYKKAGKELVFKIIMHIKLL